MAENLSWGYSFYRREHQRKVAISSTVRVTGAQLLQVTIAL